MKRNLHWICWLICPVLVAAPLFVGAQSKGPAQPSVSVKSPEHPDILSTEEWGKQLKPNARPEFCKEDGYFSKCFDFGKATCESTYNQFFEICHSGLTKREKSDARIEGPYRARNIGRCIAERVVATAKPLKLSECKDRRKWRN